MPVAHYLMNREQHEARCRAQSERQWPDNPDRVERCMERRYPASLIEAVDELRQRGLETDTERLADIAESAGLEPSDRAGIRRPPHAPPKPDLPALIRLAASRWNSARRREESP